MNKFTQLTLFSTWCLCSTSLLANTNLTTIDDSHLNSVIHSTSSETNWAIDLGWDSKYISEGRNNFEDGGIYWATAAYQYNDFTFYATLGRGDSNAYIEWDIGIEYGFNLSDNLKAAIGYQHLQGYGDNDCDDNELFASLSYTQWQWFTPLLSYTYSMEAAGYFIEASIHSSWPITPKLTLTPYITQAFDFQYATEEHDGVNHLQLGIEATYELQPQLTLSGHLSQTFAQKDIEQEAGNSSSDLDETFFGIHLTWEF